MKHRIVWRSFVMTCSLLVLVMLGLGQEARAALFFPVNDRSMAIPAHASVDLWDVEDQVAEQIANQQTVLSLSTPSISLVQVVMTSRQEPMAVIWTSLFEVDQDSQRFTFNLLLQDRPGYGPVQLPVSTVNLASSSPVVPVAPTPSSVLLFLPALVGLLGVVLREKYNSPTPESFTESTVGQQPSGSSPYLLVLSADPAFGHDVQELVHRAGYTTRVTAEVNETLVISDHVSPALLLVDRRVPDWDMLRTSPLLRSVPLITLAPVGSQCTEEQWMSDLDRGADGTYDCRDGGRLFLAKIRAYLRRAGDNVTRRGVYQVGAVELDADTHEVKVAGQPLQLSAKPFAILKVLMQAPSKVFSRRELVDRVWGPQFAIGEHTLDVHVHALRRQLDRDPQRLCRLITIKGVGFKLKAADSVPPVLTSTIDRSACPVDSNKVEELTASPGFRPRYVGITPTYQSHSPQAAAFRRVARRRPSRMSRRPTAVPDFGSAALAG